MAIDVKIIIWQRSAYTFPVPTEFAARLSLMFTDNYREAAVLSQHRQQQRRAQWRRTVAILWRAACSEKKYC